jgi:hypothetical protein
VAISGDTQNDLVRGEAGIRPCLDGLDARTSRGLGARVIQRSIGTSTRFTTPLTLKDESSNEFFG